jgi:hypothetical protein
LHEIYNMVTNPEIISEDKRNYSTARRQASYIVEQLMHLRNRLKMDKKAYDMGLQFTVKSAFLSGNDCYYSFVIQQFLK